jgi:hypothetical protein
VFPQKLQVHHVSFFPAEETVNGQMGFYKKPDGFPTLQELSGGFSTKVEQKVAPPNASQDRFVINEPSVE